MLNHNETNSGSISTQDENSFSKNSLEQKIESLGKEIKSLRKQNRLNSGIIGLGVIGLVGYIIATNWSTVAPALATAGTAIAAASPVIGIVIGAIVGAVVLAGVSYAIWKHRAQIKEGFKYAADKTVEGAKYTAGKIKDGAMHAKDSLKEAASSLTQAAREKTSSALEKMGDSVQKLGRKMSNSGVSISDLERIPYSIERKEPQGVVLLAKQELNPDLIGSNRDSLQSNSLPKSNSVSSLNSVGTDSSTAQLLNSGEHKKAPTLLKDKPLSWFGGKKAGEATNVEYKALPKSSMPPSVMPDSRFVTANSSGSSTPGSRFVTVNSSTPNNDEFHSSGLSEPVDGKELKERLEELSKPSSTTSRSGSTDSGRGSSDSSTPRRQSLSLNDLNQSRLKETGLRNKLVGQQPSTLVATNTGPYQHVPTQEVTAGGN